MRSLILASISLFLLSGCFTAVEHAYDGPELPPTKVAGLSCAAYHLEVTEINGDRNTGQTFYIKPGITKLTLVSTIKEGNMRYTNKWKVKFKTEMGHTYVFDAKPALSAHHYFLLGKDMGTNYKIDREKPFRVISQEAATKGKKIKFLKTK